MIARGKYSRCGIYISVAILTRTTPLGVSRQFLSRDNYPIWRSRVHSLLAAIEAAHHTSTPDTTAHMNMNNIVPGDDSIFPRRKTMWDFMKEQPLVPIGT